MRRKHDAGYQFFFANILYINVPAIQNVVLRLYIQQTQS